MAVSEVPDTMPQAPEVTTNEASHGNDTWPPELEICIEYCMRTAFHARYDPDKYTEYFQLVRDAFHVRSAQTKIVGNPFTGRTKMWTSLNSFGGLQDNVEFPRLAAFEVTVKSLQTGSVTIFSKLETRRWPNPRVLVLQVDRLLRGETLLNPLPSARGHSPRKGALYSPRQTEQGATATSWGASKSSVSSPPRTPRSPERTAANTTMPRPGSKKSSPGRTEAPITQETVQPVPPIVTAMESTGPDMATPPSAHLALDTSKEVFRTISPSKEDLEDNGYGEDFEESGEGSSCYGTKVWMPGAVKSEKWENWEADVVSEQQLDVTAKPGEAKQRLEQ